MNISIYIERLILDGINIEPGQGARVKAAVEAELSHLLSEGGLQADFLSSRAFQSLPAPAIQANEGIHPDRLGQRIAWSVYNSIGQGKPRQSI